LLAKLIMAQSARRKLEEERDFGSSVLGLDLGIRKDAMDCRGSFAGLGRRRPINLTLPLTYLHSPWPETISFAPL